MGNDFDPDGDGFAVSAVADPAHGTVTSFGPTHFVYEPDTGFAGTDTVSYTVRDGTESTGEGSVVVRVDTGLAGDQTPNPFIDYFVVRQGSTVGFSVGDLLANDNEPQGQPMTVLAISEPGREATLAGSIEGGFTYTPGGEASFVGHDFDLAYLVVDPDGHVAQETIRIRILAAGDTNRPPVARDDVVRTDLNAAVQVTPLGNDFDPDDDEFSIVSMLQPAHGTVTSFGPTHFDYEPDTGFSGTDSVTYVLRDAHGLVASGRVTVHVDTGAAGPQTPNPFIDYFVVSQGSSVGFTVGDLLANDNEPQGQPLTVIAVSQPANGGTLTGSVAGGFTYTPGGEASFVGHDFDLAYLVVDPDGHVAQETIRIRILAADDTNRAPVARDDVVRTDLNASVQVTPLGNDFDPDDDEFSIVSMLQPAHGTVTSFGPTHFVYEPDTGFSGTDSVTYVLRDTHGLVASGRVTVHVDTGAAGPQTPNPFIDYFVVRQGSSVGFSVADLLANDNEPQGQPMTVIAVSQPANGGTLTGSVAGGFTYTPGGEASFVGHDFDLAYLVVDPDGHVAQETIRIRILAADDTNRAPVARDDVVRTDLNASVQVTPLGNDFDPDDDAFSIVSMLQPAHGTVTSFGPTHFVYEPDTGFSGTDSVTYVLRDGHGLVASGRVTVHVDTGAAGPQTPNPFIDYFVVRQGSSVGFSVGDLLANDNEPQGQPMTVIAVSQPANGGTLTGSVAGGFTYTPGGEASFVGQDFDLAYLVVDPDGHVAQETIRIRILAADDTNRPPVAVPDTASSSGAAVQVTPLGNDFDPDDDAFSIVSMLQPAHGTVTSFGPTHFNYEPDTGFSGTDSVTYVLRDTHGLVGTGLVAVRVNTTGNQPPVAGSAHYTVQAGRHDDDHAQRRRPGGAAAHVDSRHATSRRARRRAHRGGTDAHVHRAGQPAHGRVRLRGQRRNAHGPRHDPDPGRAGQHRPGRRRRHRRHHAGAPGRHRRPRR